MYKEKAGMPVRLQQQDQLLLDEWREVGAESVVELRLFSTLVLVVRRAVGFRREFLHRTSFLSSQRTQTSTYHDHLGDSLRSIEFREQPHSIAQILE